MIDHKYIGFVSNKINFKDNDAIINVITVDGKKTFKARGILKLSSNNAKSCNYFMISEFLCNSKSEVSNQSLKSASLIKMYKKPYDDLLVSACYLCICNLLDSLSNEINGYDLAINCFDKLEEEVYPIDVLNYFLKNLCNTLGYQSNLNGCVYCNKKNELISFDFESGGFICNNCFNVSQHEKMTTSYLKDVYNFLKEDELLLIKQHNSIKLLNQYIRFLKEVVGISTKCFDFVIKCI